MGKHYLPNKTWVVKWKSQSQAWHTSLWVGEVKQNTKTIQVTVIVFGCLPELNGEIMKTQFSFVVGEIQLQLTWCFSSLLASFQRAGRCSAGHWGLGESSMVSPRGKPSMLWCWPAKHIWHKSGLHIVEQPAAFQLDLRSIPQEGIHAPHCKPGPKPMA